MPKVKETFTTYSKKKGAYSKSIIVFTGTFDECVGFVRDKYKTILSKEKLEASTSGLLYPGSIKIIGK